MKQLTMKMGTVAVMAVVAAGGMAFSPTAHADALYKTDRAYCMSGQATQPRALCLKEAAAAQAERQRGSKVAEKGHRKHRPQGA